MQRAVRIPIEEGCGAAEARRIGRKLGAEIGFDEARAEKIAIVVTEACTNILKHAGRGELLIGVSADAIDLEVLALDRGPGMGNVEQCRRDGFSTSTSPGQGMGAIERLSDASDFYSVGGKGTAVFARWSGSCNGNHGLKIGAVNVGKRGQDVCGDSWGVEETPDVTTFLVADGLGHGYDASIASRQALQTLRGNPGLTPMALLELTHRALRSSRGAAVAIARVDRLRGQVTFSGVGNIAGQIYSGAAPSQHLVSVNGTAGSESPRLREFVYPWPEKGMLLLHSDGLSTGTGLESQPRLALHHPGLIAGVLYRDFDRGLDDATVVVAKAA